MCNDTLLSHPVGTESVHKRGIADQRVRWKEQTEMPQWAWMIVFIAAYLVLTQWLLPKLGVPT
jgi:hypothetical protein